MKTFLKQIANGLATLLVLPCLAVYWLQSRVSGEERAFPGWSQGMSLFPGVTGVYLRRAFYRVAAGECGADACITFGTVFSHPTLRIGKRVYVGAYCCIGDVTLEDDVLVGSHVSIMNGGQQHGIERLDIPIREQPGVWPRVTIGRDTWIGDRVVVMSNVGRGCVIGSGAVVTQPLPDYSIAVGVPARVIRKRSGMPVESDTSPGSCCEEQEKREPGGSEACDAGERAAVECAT